MNNQAKTPITLRAALLATLGVLALTACPGTGGTGGITPQPPGNTTPPPNTTTPPAPIESRTPRDVKVTMTGPGAPIAGFAPTKVERSPFGTDTLLVNLENDKYRITCSVKTTARTGTFTIGQSSADCRLFEFGTQTVWGLAWANSAQAVSGSFTVDNFGADLNISLLSNGGQTYSMVGSGDYSR